MTVPHHTTVGDMPVGGGRAALTATPAANETAKGVRNTTARRRTLSIGRDFHRLPLSSEPPSDAGAADGTIPRHVGLSTDGSST